MYKKSIIATGLLVIVLIILILTFYRPLHRRPSHKNIPFIPDNNAIYGIDISHHQGIINWAEVKEWEGQKIRFVYIKATEGATDIDHLYSQNFAEARKSRLLVGSYHYFRTSSSPQEQFDNFKKVTEKDSQDLIPLVDVEEKKNWDDKTFHKNLALFLRLVENHFGKKPLIYTVNSFYNQNLAGRYNENHFLIGRYGKNSPNMKDKRDWTIWQFSEAGQIEGIPKPVDIDVLNNSVDLNKLILNDFVKIISEGNSKISLFQPIGLKLGIKSKRPLFSKEFFLCVPAAFTSKTGQIEGLFFEKGVQLNIHIKKQFEGTCILNDDKVQIIETKKLNQNLLDEVKQNKSDLFQQLLLVNNSKIVDCKIFGNRKNLRRAIIQFDKLVCIGESQGSISIREFQESLVKIGAVNAIYLDMGTYSEGWYRNHANEKIVIGEMMTNTSKQTNWLTFTKK